MIRTILAGGHLVPFPRPDGFGGQAYPPGAFGAYGGGLAGPGSQLHPLQTAEQLMRSTEQAFVSQAVAEGGIVSVVSNFRFSPARPRLAADTAARRGLLRGTEWRDSAYDTRPEL